MLPIHVLLAHRFTPAGPAGKGARGGPVKSTNQSGEIGGKKKRRERPSNDDIPGEMQKAWNKILLPKLRRKLGQAADPWAQPTVAEIQDLMDDVFPDYKAEYEVVEGDAYHHLVSVLLRVVLF